MNRLIPILIAIVLASAAGEVRSQDRRPVADGNEIIRRAEELRVQMAADARRQRAGQATEYRRIATRTEEVRRERQRTARERRRESAERRPGPRPAAEAAVETDRARSGRDELSAREPDRRPPPREPAVEEPTPPAAEVEPVSEADRARLR
ncbi:MAG: hypothetical protein V3T00_07055, partial [bacterium]